MKALVALSGGMDSATVLAEALVRGREVVRAVGFSYGSKHNQYENKAAAAIADNYGVPFHLIDLSGAMEGFRSNLLKSGGDVPEGHYEAESMRQTVVPGRNLIFISILAGLAESLGAEELFLGVHSGDHHIYPDCRPEFLSAANDAVRASSDGKLRIHAPFLLGNKTTIIRRGLELLVPYRLTRTCYKDQPTACGRCGSCQERLAAWKEIGMEDPIPYETRELLPS